MNDKLISSIQQLYDAVDLICKDDYLNEVQLKNRGGIPPIGMQRASDLFKLSEFCREIENINSISNFKFHGIKLPIEILRGGIHYLNIVLYIAEHFYDKLISFYKPEPIEYYQFIPNDNLLTMKFFEAGPFIDFKNCLKSIACKTKEEVVIRETAELQKSLAKVLISFDGFNQELLDELIKKYKRLVIAIGDCLNKEEEIENLKHFKGLIKEEGGNKK